MIFVSEKKIFFPHKDILRKIFFIAGIFVTFLVVILRGDVGTDTATYLDMAQRIEANSSVSATELDVEMGFYWMLKALIFLTSDPRIVINSISGIIVFYAYYIFSKSDERFLVFVFLIFPIFLFDMSMNGLRYGLAFLLAKHASDKLKENIGISAFLLTLSILFQISGILVFSLLVVKRINFKSIFILVILSFLLFFLFQERLEYKLTSYMQLQSPSVLSGLFPLIIFGLTFFAALITGGIISKNIVLLLVLEIVMFALAKLTYAGLRFQLLILFVFFCRISDLSFSKFQEKKITNIFIFLLIGLIGCFGTYKHYIDDYGMGPSPFIPYEFYWDIL